MVCRWTWFSGLSKANAELDWTGVIHKAVVAEWPELVGVKDPRHQNGSDGHAIGSRLRQRAGSRMRLDLT